MPLRRSNIVQLFPLVAFPGFALFAAIALRANYFVAELFFYLLPALWFSLQKGWKAKKILLFSLLSAPPLWIIADYLALANKAWTIPSTIFPFRILGLLPIEDLLWFFFSGYLTISFYEFVSDKGKKEILDGHMKLYFFAMLGGLALLMAGIFFAPDLLQFRYAYFTLLVLFFLLPTLIILSLYPRLIAKFSAAVVYYWLVTILFEIAALYLDYWIFEGEYVLNPFRIFGKSFAWEELIFVVGLGPFFGLALYEFFDDDRK